MEIIEQLDRALLLLDSLTTKKIEEEASYQEWFEKNPIIFKEYGYKDVIPHPVFHKHTGEDFIPDFLCMRLDGIWDIVEIKTPQVTICKDKERRNTFYAEVGSYISQCCDYSRVAGDSYTQSQFKCEYGIDISYSPYTRLIVGINNNQDPVKLHELVSQRRRDIDIITYEDIYDRLQLKREDIIGRYESKPGLSIALKLSIIDIKDRDQYIIDFGSELDRNRISVVFTSNGYFELRIFDDMKNCICSRLMINYAVGRVILLTCEIGTNADGYGILISCNGVVISTIIASNSDIKLNISLQWTLGAAINKTMHAAMMISECSIYKNSLSYEGRSRLWDFGLLCD